MIANDQIPKINESKRIEFETEKAANARAVADPLPGPLQSAFGARIIQIGKYEIRQCVAYDFAVFKGLNSPVHRQMLETMQDGENAEQVEFTEQESWDLAFQFTRPCKEVDRVYQKGKEAYQAASREAIAFEVNLAELNLLIKACMQQILAHMKTMVEYAQEQKEDGKKDFFPQQPGMASAGG